MTEFHEFDYTVTKKPEGQYRVKRMLMIGLYVLFGIVYFFGLAAIHLYPVMALIIFFEWMLVFFTWRYVSIEYKYSIISGNMTFYEVYGGKKKKLLLEKRIKEFSSIEPYTAEAKARIDGEDFKEKHILVRSENDHTDCFYATYDLDGGRGIVVFEATQGALKILRFYNSNTVIAETRY